MKNGVIISFDEFVCLVRGSTEKERVAIDLFTRFMSIDPSGSQATSGIAFGPITLNVDLPQKTDESAARGPRSKWTEDKILKMIKMKAEGKKTEEIAEAFGTTKSTIFNLMFKFKTRNKAASNQAEKEGTAEYLSKAVAKSRMEMVEYLRAAGYKIAQIEGKLSHDGCQLSDQKLLDLANKERARTRLPVFSMLDKAA